MPSGEVRRLAAAIRPGLRLEVPADLRNRLRVPLPGFHLPGLLQRGGSPVYGWRARIGLIVPSSNTTMEPELYRMAPQGVSVHTSRVPLREVVPSELLEMERSALRAARELADAEVDLVLYGCTSGSLIGGPEFDRAIEVKIREATGRPALTTATAVVEALRALGARRVAVATPYVEEVNEAERRYLEAHGFEVVAVRGMGIRRNVEIGRVPPHEVYRLARSVYREGADGLFISCTNLRTIEVVELLERDLGVPVVTSNQASMWASLRRLGIGEKIGGFGRLLML